MLTRRPSPDLRPAPWLLRGQRVLPWLDGRSVVALALPLLLYLLTLAPTIYNLDSAELTTAAATGGIVRATGYPLYLLLGRGWSQLPLGDVGYRMNLFSAVWGALTVALLERVLRRWQVGPWAAFGALGLLSVSTFFWGLSLIAEVYTLHAALMAGTILLLLRWSERPTAGRLALVALVVGLSFGNHAATVLLVPGCAWFLLTVAPRQLLAPRPLALAVAAGLVGLSVYLYLPWLYRASPAFNYAGSYDATGTFQPVNLQTVSGMWWLVSGKAFRGLMMGYDEAGLWGEARNFGIHLWRAFFAVGIGPGVLGLALLLRRDWRAAGALVLMFVCSAAFYIDYRAVDKETMFLPTYVVWVLWLAVGLQGLLDWVRESDGGQGWGSHGLHLAILAAVLLATLSTWPLVDLSDDLSTRQRGEQALAQVAPNALLFGWWETVPVVEYLQLVEGQRPDVQAINRFLIPYEALEALILQQIDERPIYIDVPPQALLAQVEARKEGTLYRLYRPPPADSRRAPSQGR